MLSAYLDGQLDPVGCSSIEEHISRCEECYFVVRETAMTWTETGAVGSSLGEPEATGSGADTVVPISTGAPKGVRPRASLVRRYLLPMAATLIVGSGSLALWRQAHSAEAYVDAVRPLVEAVGERRFFEPRLTGGFKYGPRVSNKRSTASGPDSGSWDMLAAAGELRARAANSSGGARASRAAAALFAGDVEMAVAGYEQLLQDDPGTAAWASNLAAALLVHAADEGETLDRRDRDAESALRHAEAALRLDSELPEARFNRGLALKALGRSEEAQQTFTEIERQGGSWSAAAREQLRDISEALKRRP
jgi:tetratricopeptide (TPR) repeat protein